MSDKITCEVDKNILDMLLKGLNTLRGGPAMDEEEWEEVGGRKKRRGRGAGPTQPKAAADVPEVDNTDLNGVINKLLDTVNTLLEKRQLDLEARERQDIKIEKMEARIELQSVENDETKQRSLKGNIIISSPPGQDKLRILKSKEDLEKEEYCVTDYAIEIMQLKYGVSVPKSDIQACHFLPNKSILLRIWNRVPGSAWSILIDKIKKGGNKEYHVYGNFMLTARRNAISYHLRTLKKSGKISKLYTTESGVLSFKIKDDRDKIRVTYVSNKKGDDPRTLSIKEIDSLL
jgi:hypothetical protein